MRARVARIAVPVAVVAAAVVVLLVVRHRNGMAGLAASGTVEATTAQLGFPAAGRIEEIAVHEGDPVKTGADLARLDRTEAEARHAQAAAQVAAARAQLDELTRGYRSEEVAQARAASEAADSRLADARRDLDRARQLHDAGAESQEAYDKAKLAFDVAQSQATQAREERKLREAGPRPETIDAQRAALAAAEASVAQIEAALSNMTIRAPFDGVVTVRHREPGEAVAPGAAVLTVMNRDDRWVRIYVPETRVGTVRLGAPAAIRCDTYPGRSYGGEVSFIASEAEFTPKTVQTSEERVKLVYAVKVRITRDPSYDLKPGMPADVRLEPAGP